MSNTIKLLEHAFQISKQLPATDPLKNSLDSLLAQVSNLVDVEIHDLLKTPGYLNIEVDADNREFYSYFPGKPAKASVKVYLCPNGNQACHPDCPHHNGFKRYGGEPIPTCPQTHQSLQLFTEIELS